MEEREEVVAELQAVLRDSQFAHSKRYPALLRYLVEHTLDGDIAQIKERTLGIEVFGRSASYDTTSDTVVRFTASEVRRRLATFYLQNEHHAIHISLPIGSYVPEFLRAEGIADEALPKGPPLLQPPVEPSPAPLDIAAPQYTLVETEPGTTVSMHPTVAHAAIKSRHSNRWLGWALLCLALVAAGLGGAVLLHRHAALETALQRLWEPLTHDAKPPLIVAGGNVFSSNPYSGTETASRDVNYPFVSMQIASAMARVSAILQSQGSNVEIQSANTVTLSELRDRPLVLIGGYNNEWTERLTANLPIHLAPKGVAAFEEAGPNGRRWQRDRSQPYAGSDDYALIGQYRDSTTGNAIVLMAGIGRNGSEAASQFLTDERRLRSLEDAMKHKLNGLNFEAVLQVPVIQGRTGAPSILYMRTW